MATREDGRIGFWGGDRVERLHPRLVAELLLDAVEFDQEPRLLMEYLKKNNFSPDYVRSKGYISGQHVVAILPMLSADLSQVAGIGVRKNFIDPSDAKVTAAATTVKMVGAINPLEFTLLEIEDGEVCPYGPVAFDLLRREGSRGVVATLIGRERLGDIRLERRARGREIAAAAIEDLAREERDIGFINESEFHQLVQDAEFYADVARLHSYLFAVSMPADGCNYCSTSTSCYVCTSTCCHIFSGSCASA